MKRYIRANITIPEHAVRALDRMRRGTHEPFARFAGRMLVDALDDASRRIASHRAAASESIEEPHEVPDHDPRRCSFGSSRPMRFRHEG